MLTYSEICCLFNLKYQNYPRWCDFDNPDVRIVDNYGSFTVFVNNMQKPNDCLINWTAMATVEKNNPVYSLRIAFDKFDPSYRNAETETFNSLQELADTIEKYRKDFVTRAYTKYKNAETYEILNNI